MTPLELATLAHDGQVRKYTGEPYVEHCKAVAGIVSGLYYCTWQMAAAAMLHDVGEDAPEFAPRIAEHFGATVWSYVWWLTDTPSYVGNRRTRKQVDRKRLAAAPWEVQTIKLADLIDNTSSIVQHDPKFAETYLAEKRALLQVMNQGDTKLYKQALALVTP